MINIKQLNTNRYKSVVPVVENDEQFEFWRLFLETNPNFWFQQNDHSSNDKSPMDCNTQNMSLFVTAIHNRQLIRCQEEENAFLFIYI